MLEKSENFNSLRPILFELCKKNYRGRDQIAPPAGIGLNICPLENECDISFLKKWLFLIFVSVNK